MQIDDVPVLAWAVRRELDIHLGERPVSSNLLAAWIGTLVQVATVSATDGCSYLLHKLYTALPKAQEADHVYLSAAVGALVRSCLKQQHLRAALLLVTSHWHNDPLSAAELLSLDLSAEDLLDLGIFYLESADPVLSGLGQELARQVLQDVQGTPAALPAPALYSAYTRIRSQGLDIGVSDTDLRRLLSEATPASISSAKELLFSCATRPLSSQEAAASASCTPLSAEEYAAAARTSEASGVREIADPARLAALAPLAQHSIDVAGLLDELAPMTPEALADAIREAGPQCSRWPQQLSSVLGAYPNATPTQLAALIAHVASTAESAAQFAAKNSRPEASWNIEGLASSLKAQYPSTSWDAVYRALDTESFFIPDDTGCNVLLTFWSLLADGAPFPINHFVSGIWSNLKGQMSFLRFAVFQPPDVVDFSRNASTVKPLDLNRKEYDVRIANSLANSSWYCLDLLRVLMMAAEQPGSQLVDMVLSMLHPTRRCPEAMVLGFASVPVASGDIEAAAPRLQKQMIANFGPEVVRSPGVGAVVLARVAGQSFAMLQYMLHCTYKQDQTAITDILNAAQELGILQQLLEGREHVFTLDLAVLANRREFLNLEKWLPQYIATDPPEVINALTTFMMAKLELGPGAKQVPLEAGSLQQIIAVLHALAPSLSNSQKLQLQSALQRAQQQLPNVQGQRKATDGMDVKWTAATEKRADAMFCELYEKGEEGVAQMVARMRQIVATEDVDITEYMCKEIFEEYPFFGKYPEDKLRITAAFIGQVLANEMLVSRSTLLAMKMVLECLQVPVEKENAARVRMFAIHSLRYMLPMLKNHGSYCERVLACQEAREALASDPSLLDALLGIVTEHAKSVRGGMMSPPGMAPSLASAGLSPIPSTTTSSPRGGDVPPGLLPGLSPSPSQQPASQASTGVSGNLPPVQQQQGAGAAAAQAMQSAEFNSAPQPEKKVRDRVAFILNNVQEDSVPRLGQELIGKMLERHFPWFARMLVTSRVGQEAMFQELYAQLIDAMRSRALYKVVLRMSCHIVRDLLYGREDPRVQTIREMLKNLGSWIGKLTLARNFPVLRRELDFRALIIEAYQKGHMIATLPFVGKVLSEGRNSPVFSSAKNPWIRGLLMLFKEIEQMKDLKMALQFEIQNLFTMFKVPMEGYERTSLLARLPRPTGDDNPDFKIIEQPNQPHPPGRGGGGRGDDAAAVPPPPGMPPPGMPPGFGGPVNTARGQVGSPSMDGEGGGGGAGAPQGGAPPKRANMPTANANLYKQLHVSIRIPRELEEYRVRWQLDHLVSLAMDRAVAEIMESAVARSVMIACETARQLVTKDFANDVDETRVRTAARQMAGALASGLALVTCQDTIDASLSNAVYAVLSTVVQDGAVLEQATKLLTSRNKHVGTTFIEQTALDKATQDIDECMMSAVAHRREHKRGAFSDPTARCTHDGLPEILQLRSNNFTAHQGAVYEAFTRISTAALSSTVAERWKAWLESYDAFVHNRQTVHNEAENEKQQRLVDEAKKLAEECSNPTIVEDMARQLFRHMWASATRYAVTLGVTIIGGFFKGQPGFARMFVTEAWLTLDEESRWKLVPIDVVLKLNMLEVTELDLHLAAVLKARGAGAGDELLGHMKFLIDLIQHFVIGAEVVPMHDLLATITTLHGAPGMGRAKQTVLKLVESALTKCGLLPPRAGRPFSTHSAISCRFSLLSEQREASMDHNKQAEVAELMRQRAFVATSLDEWAEKCERADSEALEPAFVDDFVSQLHEQRLVTKDVLGIFLKYSMDLLIVHSLQLQLLPPPPVPTVSLNHFCALVGALVRSSEVVPNEVVRSALSSTASIVLEASRRRKAAFQPRPFFRLLLGLLHEIPFAKVPKSINWYAQTLQTLEPRVVPGFAFCWLELLAHQKFLRPLIQEAQGVQIYKNLMVSLLHFLEAPLRSGAMTEPLRALYTGTMRLMLVVSHEYPDVLVRYHTHLLAWVPPRCLQLKNVILSAYPRRMQMQDPYELKVKFEQLPGMDREEPCEMPPMDNNLLPRQLYPDLEMYMRPGAATSDAGKAFLVTLPHRLSDQTEQLIRNTRYSVPAMTAVVLYAAQVDMNMQRSSGAAAPFKPSGAAWTLVSHLCRSLEADGLYTLFSVLANQLRFPCVHTHYFLHAVLMLFGESSADSVAREVIARVLVERMIVARPHPWGLIVAFVELLRNPRFDFMKHRFIGCAPEVRAVFEAMNRHQGEGPGKMARALTQIMPRLGTGA